MFVRCGVLSGTRCHVHLVVKEGAGQMNGTSSENRSGQGQGAGLTGRTQPGHQVTVHKAVSGICPTTCTYTLHVAIHRQHPADELITGRRHAAIAKWFFIRGRPAAAEPREPAGASRLCTSSSPPSVSGPTHAAAG